MIKDDHAFVVQSMSLRTEQFEKYLAWLLGSKTSFIGATVPVILNASFDIAAFGGNLEDIQEIIVGGVAGPLPTLFAGDTLPTAQGSALQVTEVMQTQNIDTRRATGWDTAREILKQLLGGDAAVDSVMNAVPADAELNVEVHIGFQTKKRKVDRVALKNLEIGLRNLPDSQLQVKAKGAKMGKDGSVRLHHNANIALIQMQVDDSQLIGSLLDPADVLRAMLEAFNNFRDNGKI